MNDDELRAVPIADLIQLREDASEEIERRVNTFGTMIAAALPLSLYREWQEKLPGINSNHFNADPIPNDLKWPYFGYHYGIGGVGVKYAGRDRFVCVDYRDREGDDAGEDIWPIEFFSTATQEDVQRLAADYLARLKSFYEAREQKRVANRDAQERRDYERLKAQFEGGAQ